MGNRRRKKGHGGILLFSVLFAIVISAFVLTDFSDKLGIQQVPVLSDVRNSITDIKDDISPSTKTENKKNNCEVHFIDVGQGDSILIISDGKTILIDAGENDKGKVVVDYLKKLGIKKIDLLIATHPHSDHIGGMDTVINTFKIGKIVMQRLPDSLVPTTRTYTDVLSAIADKGLKVTPAKVGDSYDFGSGKLTILGPNAEYDNLNDMSIVCKFNYGKKSFLLAGDMQSSAEKDLLRKGFDLKSDVLKVGHHGSSTSTTKQFYKAVNPKYCVISVGDGNSFGHPNAKTLKTIATNGAKIYRTDFQGSIVIGISDGKINVSCEKGGKS